MRQFSCASAVTVRNLVGALDKVRANGAVVFLDVSVQSVARQIGAFGEVNYSL